MPTCLECGERIERGMYCAKHRLDTGSTLGVVIDDDRYREERPTRGGDDHERKSPDRDRDGVNLNYRGE